MEKAELDKILNTASIFFYHYLFFFSPLGERGVGGLKTMDDSCRTHLKYISLYDFIMCSLPKSNWSSIVPFRKACVQYLNECMELSFSFIYFIFFYFYCKNECQDPKQLQPPHGSHMLALTQACPNNLNGGPVLT